MFKVTPPKDVDVAKMTKNLPYGNLLLAYSKLDASAAQETFRTLTPGRSNTTESVLNLVGRMMVIEGLFSEIALRPSKDITCRVENRIREGNTWPLFNLATAQPDRWQWAMLPAGKRVVAIFSKVFNKVLLLDRTSFTSYMDIKVKFPYKGNDIGFDAALDCIVSKSDGSLTAYDAIHVNGVPLCHKPLQDRLAQIPEGIAQVVYNDMSSIEVGARSLDRKDGRRIIIVDKLAQYRYSSNICRTAFIWRPPRPANVAVLCLRNGEAMCFGVDCIMAPVGRVAEGSKYDHLGCYACMYSNGVWKVIERVKRKEPLSNWEKCENITSGNAICVDGVEMFHLFTLGRV